MKQTEQTTFRPASRPLCMLRSVHYVTQSHIFDNPITGHLTKTTINYYALKGHYGDALQRLAQEGLRRKQQRKAERLRQQREKERILMQYL